MTTTARMLSERRPQFAPHIASDVLGLWRAGEPDYKKIAGLVQLSKKDLSKLGGVSIASVRFDQNIPQAVAERLREIANIANLVGEFFDGDMHKVGLWFELANPQLGGISPRTMIRAGRYKRLLNFVLEARAAEQAAAEAKAEAEAQQEVASRPVTT
jgi:hypothetical protein